MALGLRKKRNCTNFVAKTGTDYLWDTAQLICSFYCIFKKQVFFNEVTHIRLIAFNMAGPVYFIFSLFSCFIYNV